MIQRQNLHIFLSQSDLQVYRFVLLFFDNNFFFSDDIGGALLFFQGYSVLLLRDIKRNIYVFDSHGRDNCGQPLPGGKSILLSFISPQDML